MAVARKVKEKKVECCCECISEKKAAVALGLLFVFLDLIKVFLVLASGGNLFSAVVAMHFVTFSFVVLPFNAVNFVAGIVFHGIVGAWVGWMFAVIWNHVNMRAG